MQSNNPKSELSYVYFHAVASQAGFTCSVSNRLDDGRGIDDRCDHKICDDSVLFNFETYFLYQPIFVSKEIFDDISTGSRDTSQRNDTLHFI